MTCHLTSHSDSELRFRRYPVLRSALRSAWLYTLAAVLIVAAAAGVIWHRKTQLLEPPRNGKYIAVIPFRALSEDQTLKYRAEGISDVNTSNRPHTWHIDIVLGQYRYKVQCRDGKI